MAISSKSHRPALDQCWPRFESPPIFGAILDEERGGAWRITCEGSVTRRYLDHTNVLATTFESHTGCATVIDNTTTDDRPTVEVDTSSRPGSHVQDNRPT